MGIVASIPLAGVADALSATNAMQDFVTPVVSTIAVLASLACVFFLINGGIHYMTSSGNPDRLQHAKLVIKNALIGLVIIIGAAVLTAILTHAYTASGGAVTAKIPNLTAIEPQKVSNGLVDILIKAIAGLFQDIIQSIAKPFLQALAFFTNGTPLIAANSAIFNLWLTIVGIADSLFILFVALLGFHVMSFATLGLEEIEFKHLLPQIGLVFLLINSSIFLIDGVIRVSNGMIIALHAGFPSINLWATLVKIVAQSGGLSLAALLIMVVFLILAVILLVYYVGRLVTLYIGAVLAPVLLLLYLLPSFKDFVENAVKTYLTTIFVLFVHVVILQLATSIFAAILPGKDNQPDPIMSMIVGISVLIALLKTQGVMQQLSYASVGPKAMRKLGGQFINSVSYVSKTVRKARTAVAS
ncbi:type IV secretion system protein [Candidatus Saccharibacteria bacterium]|nr:type IV secretion system protein [Candidatus Saccharibacteria bacterium]